MDYFIFFLKYITVALVFTAFLYMRLIWPHKLKKKWKIAGAIGCLLLSTASAFALPISIKLAKTRELYEQLSAPDLLPALYYVMVLLFVLVTFILLRDLIWIGHRIVCFFRNRRNAAGKSPKENDESQESTENSAETNAISRREFFRRSTTLATVGCAIAITPPSAYFGKKTRIIRQVPISLAALPPQLDGLRIVHLSDIHVGNTILEEDIAEIVAETNAQNPDIIAITGDIADGYPELIGSWLNPMRDFKAKYGTWFVTGNHDHMWDGHGWCNVVQNLGIRVLDNEHDILDINGTPLAIAGVIDARGDRFERTWKSDPVKALSGIDPGIFRIMLAHRPDSADPGFEAGADLVLAGHTHGGQSIPLNFVIEAMYKYASGLYKVGPRAVFVSCGTGYWGPPIRLGVPCEIDVLTLHHEQA